MLDVDGVLLLAAGKGERLKPITDKIPKPLIKIKGVPAIAFPLFLIYEAGFHEVIVNLHHLPHFIEKELSDFGKRKKIGFTFIREDVLLGTGGTIKKVFEEFGFRRILVMNSDIICYPDIKRFIEEGKRDFLAHLLVTQANLGGIDIDENSGTITKIYGEGKGGKFTFTGIHIVQSDILGILDDKVPLCIVKDGYIKAIEKFGKKISFSLYDDFFFDIGTFERLSDVEKSADKFDRIRRFFEKVRDFYFT
jgi:NDP-sugar pyrophosphorylase family protein